ncbi:MAG: hypothetical protein Q8L48_21585 [Archangium sp.]|nr:hypothetical protein [Archangium sp.]
MQYSPLAQSALEPHAVAPGERQVVGSFGQAAEPGATHAPVVWQHTSPEAQTVPPHTTGLSETQTTSFNPVTSRQRWDPPPPPPDPPPVAPMIEPSIEKV